MKFNMESKINIIININTKDKTKIKKYLLEKCNWDKVKDNDISDENIKNIFHKMIYEMNEKDFDIYFATKQIVSEKIFESKYIEKLQNNVNYIIEISQ